MGAATLIEGLDLTVQRGERWALVGPNGSGKSRVAQALTETWVSTPGRRQTDRGGLCMPCVLMCLRAQVAAGGPSSAGHVSFDLQTKMLQDRCTVSRFTGSFSEFDQDERRDFQESRYESRHLRATAPWTILDTLG